MDSAFVGSACSPTVEGAVEGDVAGAVEGAVDATVKATVDATVEDTFDAAVAGAIAGAVDGAFGDVTATVGGVWAFRCRARQSVRGALGGGDRASACDAQIAVGEGVVSVGTARSHPSLHPPATP